MKSTAQLSIITIHLDNFAGLEDTLDSLRPVISTQNNIEWIFVDGQSKPTSDSEYRVLDCASELSDHGISEPDKGIYDAMNKGAKLATGKYIMFLNSGDLLHPEINLKGLFQLMEAEPDMIWGQCVEEYTNGELVFIKTRTPRWAWYSMPVQHPVTIYRRDILPTPTFDLSYELTADYDLLLKLLTEHPKIHYLNTPLSIFRHGGVSSSLWKKVLEENETLRVKYFGFGKARNQLVTTVQSLNRQLAKSAKLRRLWRGKI